MINNKNSMQYLAKTRQAKLYSCIPIQDFKVDVYVKIETTDDKNAFTIFEDYTRELEFYKGEEHFVIQTQDNQLFTLYREKYCRIVTRTYKGQVRATLLEGYSQKPESNIYEGKYTYYMTSLFKVKNLENLEGFETYTLYRMPKDGIFGVAVFTNPIKSEIGLQFDLVAFGENASFELMSKSERYTTEQIGDYLRNYFETYNLDKSEIRNALIKEYDLLTTAKKLFLDSRYNTKEKGANLDIVSMGRMLIDIKESL